MKKYILEEYIDITYNASSKAREDISIFVLEHDYISIAKNEKYDKNKFGKLIVAVRVLFGVAKKIKKQDYLFIQSSFKILKLITKLKQIIGFKTIYLIHDLDAVRDHFYDKASVENEMKILSKQDICICHNKKMESIMRENKYNSKLVSIDIFDYKTCTEIQENIFPQNNEFEIAFAGNLSPQKTGFIYKLDQMEIKYKVNLYGVTDFKFKNNNFCYKGFYKAEDLPEIIRGNFGLIWEGDDMNYNINNDAYIKYNNPHKTSLYIVSGLPIIIWEKAAMADFVKSNGIGITIGSLNELESKLNKITYDEYSKMVKNTLKIRERLIKGFYIKKALDKAEYILNN